MFRIHVEPKIRLAEGDRNTQKSPSSPFELYPLGVLYIVGKQHLEEGSRWERLLRSFQSLLPADLNEIPKAVSEKKWLNCLILVSALVPLPLAFASFVSFPFFTLTIPLTFSNIANISFSLFSYFSVIKKISTDRLRSTATSILKVWLVFFRAKTWFCSHWCSRFSSFLLLKLFSASVFVVPFVPVPVILIGPCTISMTHRP